MPSPTHSRRDLRRRIDQFVANPRCDANVRSVVHDVPMRDVAARESSRSLPCDGCPHHARRSRPKRVAMARTSSARRGSGTALQARSWAT